VEGFGAEVVDLVAAGIGVFERSLADGGVEGWDGLAPVVDGGASDAGGSGGGGDGRARGEGLDDLTLSGS